MTQMVPLTDAQQAQLASWRSMALQRMGYFATILFAMKPYNAPGLRTFAVDKHWRLYIDFDFVAEQGWSDDMCGQVLLHECGHLFGRHDERAAMVGARTPAELRDHNIGSDLAINDDLFEAGCKEVCDFGITPPKMGLPNHETVEFYYKQVRKQSASKPSCGTCGAPKQPGGQQPGGQQPGGQQPGGQGQSQCPDCGADVEFTGCGSGAGGVPVPGELGSGGPMPGMEKVEQDAAIITTSIRIENHQKSRGNVPGGLVRQARTNLQPPLVPWQRVLSSAVRRGARLRKGDTDTTWTRRNRRRHGQSIVRSDGSRSKVVYPATVTHTPKIAVVRDTSGSMSKADLDRVGSEIVGISNSLGVKNDDLLVLDVDSSVAQPVPFRSAKVLNTIRGGGGTDMRAGIQAAYALKERPHVCVVLSDGYSPWDMPKTVGMNVVVCVVGSVPTALPQFHIPSWMKAVAVPVHG